MAMAMASHLLPTPHNDVSHLAMKPVKPAVYRKYYYGSGEARDTYYLVFSGKHVYVTRNLDHGEEKSATFAY